MIPEVSSVKNAAMATRTCISKTTRALNRIVLQELKSDKVVYTFPKATTEDLKRLTSKSLEDSYKRVTWTNPKDGKVYHILETGRENGMVNVRILDKDGEYIKDAQLKPKNIVIFDQFKSLGFIKNLLKFRLHNNITHGEIVETFLRRNNPFANITRINHENFWDLIRHRGELPAELATKRFEQLNQDIEQGKNVDYISISEAIKTNIGNTKTGQEQKEFLQKFGFDKHDRGLRDILAQLAKKGTRIFSVAGNEDKKPKRTVNLLLAIDGVEGVGALSKTSKGVKLDKVSASRNSQFTQHYEPYRFRGQVVQEDGKIIGINITGKDGVDLPYNEKNVSLIRNICGTSYSTPIRVAKLALNDMLEGIL